MNSNKEIQAVRAALMEMLDELNKIENGDRQAAMDFCYKVGSFVEMEPGLKVRTTLWRGDAE